MENKYLFVLKKGYSKINFVFENFYTGCAVMQELLDNCMDEDVSFEIYIADNEGLV